jgi:hypothetical protein
MPVEARYSLDRDRVGFVLGRYDVDQPLVIDPILSYSTAFGWGAVNRVAADSSGNAYVMGYTTTKTLPAANGYQTSLLGVQDAWIAKINPTGTKVLWATYLGARKATSTATAAAIDSSGNVYVSGTTTSTSFPHTSGAYKTTFTDTSSGFVTKLNSSGTALAYSTFVPVIAGPTSAVTMALDASNNAHIYGSPTKDFAPTASAFQRTAGNLAIVKLNPTGAGVVYATYFSGGTSGGIAVDSSGDACIGGTASGGLPVVNAIQTAPRGGQDAFAAKINPAGSALLFSTYLGGSADDYAADLAVDGAGNVIIAGWTTSSDFPTSSGVFQPAQGYFPQGGVNGVYIGATISNGFVAKIASAGSTLIWASYLGGSFCAQTGCSGTLFTCTAGNLGCPPNTDRIYSVAVDAAGYVSVGGYATSRDFPVADPIQRFGPTDDDDTNVQAFLAKFGPSGDRLVYSTAFGTRSQFLSEAQSLAVDPTGAAYATGVLGYFPTPFSPGAPFASNVFSPFLLKVSTGKYPTLLMSSTNPATTSQTITFTANVLSAKPGGTVSFMDGSTVLGTAATINGKAVLNTTLAAGPHQITAVYSADGVTSPPIYEVVTGP